LAYGRRVLPDQGVVFRDGGIIDLPCFVDDTSDKRIQEAPYR
jgi:hypothetical protein